jgi:hypothetical protein
MGSATSKHFPRHPPRPPPRDAANPSSFFRPNSYQAPSPSHSEPDSPPPTKRMPDAPRHVVTQKRSHPAAVSNEPIDLVSESEEEEVNPPAAGPSRLANSQNGSVAEHLHPASSGQMTSSSHPRHSSPPPHRDTRPRHRHQESRSSSTETQVWQKYREDPIEEYADEKGKHRARVEIPQPSERPQPKQVRARMQDRNGVVPAVSNRDWPVLNTTSEKGRL